MSRRAGGRRGAHAGHGRRHCRAPEPLCSRRSRARLRDRHCSPADADVLTGAVGDHGVDHLGALDDGNVNKIVLNKGSFEVNVSKLTSRLEVGSSNQRACIRMLKGTAPVAVSHGTGAYSGIHGMLSITVVNAVVFPRTKTGRCDENISVATVKLTWASGSGHVSF